MAKFENVKYGLIPSCNDKLKEVAVSYTANGNTNRYYIFICENPKWKDKDYLKEAKKRFEADCKAGRVKSHKSYKPSTSIGKRTGLIIATSILAVTTLGLGGFLGYAYFTGNLGGGGGGGGDTPQPGVWVKTDQDGVLVNRDQILSVTETQSPLNLISQVLNSKQFIIEKRSYVDYGPVNEGQLLVKYYIDTDAMYIKKEETDMKFPSNPPEVSYLIYDEQKLSSYKAVYYCNEEEKIKKSELIYESNDVASAKDNLNLLYLNSQLSPLVCSHARLFVDPIFETNYYGYSLDEKYKLRDNLVRNIDSYKSTWEEFKDVPEMTYQKMDNTSIKVENEKSKHVEFEGVEYDVTTKFDLLIKDGLLIDYANNMELIIPAESIKQTVYDQSSLKAESFNLDDLSEYFK